MNLLLGGPAGSDGGTTGRGPLVPQAESVDETGLERLLELQTDRTLTSLNPESGNQK